MADGKNYYSAINANSQKTANARQIGGDHYKNGNYEHWDFAREVLNNNYLLGCATKYISRWRKKSGVEDLHKALHYIDKARETDVRAFGNSSGEVYLGPRSFHVQATMRFADAAGCTVLEARALWAVACAEWDEATTIVSVVIDKENRSRDKSSAEGEASRSPTQSQR